MNRLLMMIIMVGAVFMTWADVSPTVESLMNPKGLEVMNKLRKTREEQTGGYLDDRLSFRGHIVIVNAQTKLDTEEIDAVVNGLVKVTKLPVSSSTISESDPAKAKQAANANLAIVVIDDLAKPTMLLAPEERWAIVNVAKLAAKREADFPQRCRKEIIRAFSLLCGGGCSQYRGNLLDATSFREIDLAEEMIPADVSARYPGYLANLGVTPHKVTTYKKACEEGWAPAPTNEVQQAIWDKVHAMPTEPLKIAPETTKQK